MSRTANSDAIQKMYQEISKSWEEGFEAGVLEADSPMPDWYFTKTIYMLKPWEYGYVVGRTAERMLGEEGIVTST